MMKKPTSFKHCMGSVKNPSKAYNKNLSKYVKKHKRDHSMKKSSGNNSNFSTLGCAKNGSNSKSKNKQFIIGAGAPGNKCGLSTSYTYDMRAKKKPDYSNYICSDISKKVASRTSGVNKSKNRASSSKKRGISGIKIVGNSKAEHIKHLSKSSNKYKTKKDNSISYMVPGMVSNYAHKIGARPISIKKNLKNSKLNKGFKIIKDMRTRNPKSSIYKTSDFDSQLMTNQSFQKGKC